MSIVFCGSCALTVAVIYYVWREYNARLQDRQKVLRERVTYMLWVMANGATE
jgi:hypothetical protein